METINLICLVTIIFSTLGLFLFSTLWLSSRLLRRYQAHAPQYRKLTVASLALIIGSCTVGVITSPSHDGQALPAPSSKPLNPIALAKEHIESGNYGRAIAGLQQITSSDPKFKEARGLIKQAQDGAARKKSQAQARQKEAADKRRKATSAHKVAHKQAKKNASTDTKWPPLARPVTMEDYAKLYQGMSLSDACSVLGAPNDRAESIKDQANIESMTGVSGVKVYQWRNIDTSIITTMFKDDQMIQFTQIGLK